MNRIFYGKNVSTNNSTINAGVGQVEGRVKVLLTIPADFIDRFTHFINNINALNSDRDNPVKVEEMYYDIPKEDPVEGKTY
ncbi:MAG: hypothetical protein DRN81_01150 [Thermoproteota archaeon]|nr:MAG: hypothetical protein DRN81_01150 [Candidatus Korarchaeota archaeon]